MTIVGTFPGTLFRQIMPTPKHHSVLRLEFDVLSHYFLLCRRAGWESVERSGCYRRTKACKQLTTCHRAQVAHGHLPGSPLFIETLELTGGTADVAAFSPPSHMLDSAAEMEFLPLRERNEVEVLPKRITDGLGLLANEAMLKTWPCKT
jgi:hypothetical protein